MKKNCKRLFIFDLDGTLVDAYGAIERSLNFTRRKLGYKKISLSVVKNSIGRGDKLFIKNFFELKDTGRALRMYRRHHKISLLDAVHLKPFAQQLLKRLKQEGKAVAIVSNRPTAFTNIILTRLKIKKYIDFCLCADKARKIKPHPEMLLRTLEKFKIPPPCAVYTGDMVIDLEAARGAHIESIFVRGGSGTLKQAKAYKAACSGREKSSNGVKIVSSLKEVLEYL